MLLFFLIALLSALLQVWFPWWCIVIVAGVLSFFAGKSFTHALVGGFFACGSVWLLYAFFITTLEGSLMTERIAVLFKLQASWLLYVISFLIAATGGGLGALLGFSLKRNIFDLN